jgi:hypothetical protein
MPGAARAHQTLDFVEPYCVTWIVMLAVWLLLSVPVMVALPTPTMLAVSPEG